MKESIDYPCTCGHSRINHAFYSNGSSLGCAVIDCRCWKFIPDNLKYLEIKDGSKSTD